MKKKERKKTGSAGGSKKEKSTKRIKDNRTCTWREDEMTDSRTTEPMWCDT